MYVNTTKLIVTPLRSYENPTDLKIQIYCQTLLTNMLIYFQAFDLKALQ